MTKSPIREATKSDLLAIQRLLSTYFLDIEELKPEDFLLYEIEEKIVGCAALIKSESKSKGEKFLEIHSIAVHPNFRGKKIGTKLINYLLGKAKRTTEEMGEDTCCVYVRTSTPSFFKKLKFEPINNSEKLLLWEDCKKCDHFDNCMEHVMKYQYEIKKYDACNISL